MRALGHRAATRCEYSDTPAAGCRCRCGGSHHGARRGDVRKLQPWDSHHPDNRADRSQLTLFEGGPAPRRQGAAKAKRARARRVRVCPSCFRGACGRCSDAAPCGCPCRAGRVAA